MTKNTVKRWPLKVRIAIAITTLLGTGAMLYFFIFADLNHIEQIDQRTENDYITKTYIVAEFGELQVTENGKAKYRFDIIKLKNEDFNLSLPLKVGEQTPDYLSGINEGDAIVVKVCKSELKEKEKSTILGIIKRFIQSDKRIVEVYALSGSGQVIFEKNINNSDINFRQGGDLSVFPIFVILFGLVFVVAVIRKIIDILKKQKNV